ncbi:hypothetical protein MLD38_014968 [Melastoma candidum]|uniref:Uncharacterized protein n=1 Tax=Melastoma candidum TaxID=119954 RepID=A0ACB9REM3_9MYRT|nr:hypothetical protein MLD38_014968 [Melastoma candidum]
MGKHVGRKNKSGGGPSGEKARDSSLKVYDKDTAVFIAMSHELKEEGNRLFQKREYEGAMLMYEKAIKLLPRVHIDVSYLRSNMAACYMQMGLSEYPRAINECNLALEVTPKYSKALVKRARCYEALNRLDLALRDASTVLNVEPNNVVALEIADRVKDAISERGLSGNTAAIELPPDYVEPPASSLAKVVKEKKKKSKRSRIEVKKPLENFEKAAVDVNKVQEKEVGPKRELSQEEGENKKKPEDKVDVEEKIVSVAEAPKRNVKLIFGEDIRWAELPVSCSLLQVREVIRDRFPNSQAVLIKYRDPEGDLVTITSDEELRWAEAAADSHGSLRLYVVEVSPDQDPFMAKFLYKEDDIDSHTTQQKLFQQNQLTCIADWIIHFAQLFKNYVGLDSDEYLDLQELGMKLYSEAMEETVTSEEAQNIFGVAADKFQEMAVVALFNWGNVHMSRARKGVYLSEHASEHAILEKIQNVFVWALEEYKIAGRRYEEALKIKPDFFEAYLALGQQQFEQAKLMWYHAVSNRVDLGPSDEILYVYNSAEENMEKGMQIWEQAEGQWQRNLSKLESCKVHLEKLGLDGLFNDMTPDEASERIANMRSQIILLWGSMLYERSIVEFKSGLPAWNECLEIAVEKFKLAGASATDIAAMVKNHCSNKTSVEGVGFNLDEITQTRNEMHEAQKWQRGVPSREDSFALLCLMLSLCGRGSPGVVFWVSAFSRNMPLSHYSWEGVAVVYVRSLISVGVLVSYMLIPG